MDGKINIGRDKNLNWFRYRQRDEKRYLGYTLLPSEYVRMVIQKLASFFILLLITGKSLSEALLFASTNPQYDVHWITRSVHENCKVIICCVQCT